MAISFPNYLSAALYSPDFSGIGDSVSNYYAGKAKPNDALVRQIQAQFARPSAEAALTSTQLSNEQTRLAIAKERRAQAQDLAMQKQIADALGGKMATPAGNAVPQMNPQLSQALQAPQPMAQAAPMMQQPGQPNPNNMTFQPGSDPLEAIANLHPAIAQSIQQMRQRQQDLQQAPQDAQQQPAAVSGQPQAQPQGLPEGVSMPAGGGHGAIPVDSEVAANHPIQILEQGNPKFAPIDALWDNNPLARPYLKAKGFNDKKVETRFDNKTGRTIIKTSWPSGKVTQQVVSVEQPGEGIPLTNKMISYHQNIISSVDNVLPVIKEIQDLSKNAKSFREQWEPYPRSSGYEPGLGWVPGFHSMATNYESLVKGAVDNLLGAYGLPKTNEGIDTVKGQILIDHGETDSAYKKRLERLVKTLERRREYSANEVKKSNKIQPVGRGDITQASDDELQEAVNG